LFPYRRKTHLHAIIKIARVALVRLALNIIYTRTLTFLRTATSQKALADPVAIVSINAAAFVVFHALKSVPEITLVTITALKAPCLHIIAFRLRVATAGNALASAMFIV